MGKMRPALAALKDRRGTHRRRGRCARKRERAGALEGLAWFPSRGVAHRIRGLLFSHQKSFAEATEQFAKGLELLAAHGYKPELARTHVALGECERERGRSREVRQAFEMAVACFKDMGFAFELRRTLGLLAGA